MNDPERARSQGPLLLGVVGWPIAHSRSPAMHNAALEALGLDGHYFAFAVPPARLASAIAGAAALGLRGLNVTIPHKESALALCHADAIAQRIGAVNTLVLDEAGVHGTNTDVHGFEQLLIESQAETGGRVVILGAGGGARAAIAALETRARAITLVSRTARTIALGAATYVSADLTQLPSLLAETDLLVDATPRGLDDAAPAIDLTPLPSSACVIDLVVRRETRLVRDARARGLRAAGGAAMLLHQGARALELWVGRPAPLEVMRRALERAL